MCFTAAASRLWSNYAPCAGLLSHYFGSKLSQFSQATQKSSDSEEEEVEAMDMSPQPVAAVMGQQWADQLVHILTFLQQLGLQVSPHTAP